VNGYRTLIIKKKGAKGKITLTPFLGFLKLITL
jgi:hypothetical protein